MQFFLSQRKFFNRFVLPSLMGGALVFFSHDLEALEAASSQKVLNKEFYEELSIEKLMEFADQSGLTFGGDIQRLLPYIQNAQVILEIGAGYGRAAHFIQREKSDDAVFYLVERAPHFAAILRSQFSPPTFVLHKDLKEVSIEDFSFGKPDLVLWMWSGFADFSFDEQLDALDLIHSFLEKDGLLVIDLVQLETGSNATTTMEEVRGSVAIAKIDGMQCSLQGFVPSIQHLETIAQKAGFALEKWEEYPLAGRTRIQYFLRKQTNKEKSNESCKQPK